MGGWGGGMGRRARCGLGLSLLRHRCGVRRSEAGRGSGQGDAFQDIASAHTLIVGHGILPRPTDYAGPAEHKGGALSTGYACRLSPPATRGYREARLQANQPRTTPPAPNSGSPDAVAALAPPHIP